MSRLETYLVVGHHQDPGYRQHENAGGKRREDCRNVDDRNQHAVYDADRQWESRSENERGRQWHAGIDQRDADGGADRQRDNLRQIQATASHDYGHAERKDAEDRNSACQANRLQRPRKPGRAMLSPVDSASATAKTSMA